jgi:IclR family transcriptional regulator, KDG regulon repressor
MEQHKINSVEKALHILLSFDAQHPVWGVRQLSNHLGFSPATVQRLLQTLKAYGFVDQTTTTRQYRLGKIYFRFLHTIQESLPITRAAAPYMKELAAVTQETVHLNVIDSNERVCIDTLESPQALKASMPIGSRSPLYAGASSKCLLAFSDETFRRNYFDTVRIVPITAKTIIDKARLTREIESIKSHGYAQSLGERNDGLGSLSAPIFNHRATLSAALSMAIPEIRFQNTNHRDFCLHHLRRIAQHFSHQMGYIPEAPSI